MPKQDILPTVRVDRAGYVLGDRSFDGFADRDDLSLRARSIIARMAQLYTPKTLTTAQRELLTQADSEPIEPSARLVDLTHNLENLEAAHEAGLLEDLSAAEIAFIREPSSHPGAADARYPLTIAQAATITGASNVQLRRWAEARLIPSRRIDGRLHFLGAGVLHAMLLVKVERYEVSALMRILRGGDTGERFVRLLGVTLESISTTAEEDDDAARKLSLAAATLVQHSKTIRKAAEAYTLGYRRRVAG